MNARPRHDAFRLATEAASARPLIRFEGVGKTYPARGGQVPVSALEGIDLAVPEGAILGVIGRSGAGKSTLIRLVNGLERATAGRILIDGEDVTALTEAGWRARRRRTGMIFQHFNLLSSRTVFDNVALPLEIAGVPKTTIGRRVTELLDLVGLSDKHGRYPAELSGGQKQRVGIARALATDPQVLLCDEATSALDPETTQQILTLLRRVNRDLGITILLITHEIPVIKEICDRVAVIEDGRIVEEGETFAVFTRPSHPTTARFVEAVTGVEVPAHIQPLIHREARPGDQALLRITFTGENATAPVISRLSTVVGVDVNIVAGRIDAIAGQPFGSLIVSVPGSGPEKAAVIAALKNLDLKVAELGHVS